MAERSYTTRAEAERASAPPEPGAPIHWIGVFYCNATMAGAPHEQVSAFGPRRGGSFANATPRGMLRDVLAQLGKRPTEVSVAAAKTGVCAIISNDKPPVALVYIEDGITRAEVADALRQLREEGP